MDCLKHRTLVKFKSTWHFKLGTSIRNKLIPLPNLARNAIYIVHSFQFAHSHVNFKQLMNSRAHGAIHSIVACHVSATGLTSDDVPTLLQQRHLNPTDKAIWDAAYAEEFDGLTDLPCWTVISEKEFKHIKYPHTKVLPTIMVSTITFDKDGLPVCVKYQIVSLGNLETTKWSKINVYAPVMSLLELCLLTALWQFNTKSFSKMVI